MPFVDFAKYFITIIPLLTLQWIGVIALRKTGQPGVWWCMLSGTAVVTLMQALIPAIFAWQRLWGHEMLMQLHKTASYTLSCGSLLFGIGFAIHSCRLARFRERITELEMMNLAQATELERLRNR